MRPIDGGDDAGVPSEDPSTKLTYDFESSLVTHLELELYQNRGWIQIIDVRLAKGRMFGTLMMMTWSCLGIISSWRAYGLRNYFFLEGLRSPLEPVMYEILSMFVVSFH